MPAHTTFHFDSWTDLDATLDALVAKVETASIAALKTGAQLLRAQVMQHMNGRPGPNVITGTLRRSVAVGTPKTEGLGVWSTTVAPTVIYARRIELGFDGADSLGRVYHQPPYPYFTPGLQDTQRLLDPVLTAAWARSLEV